MLLALATPRAASTVEEALFKIEHFLAQASALGVRLVCFPEAYLPGLRGLDFFVPPFDLAQQEQVLPTIASWARRYRIGVILGMEWHSDVGRQIGAVVFDRHGRIQGCQTKNQLDPSEDSVFVPGETRRIFEIEGLKFGIAICHEGFRYPETVRWAARRGAVVVFHPHCTGSDHTGVTRAQWGVDGPYYEKAMMCRALENTIYFGSVNYAFRYQDSATSWIGPSGECLGHLPYGQEGLLIQAIDLQAATGLLAARLAPERYRDQVNSAIGSP